MKFLIGNTIEDKTQKLMVDALVLADTRALINGSSGAGKSQLIRVIVEAVAPHIQTIVLDPEGEFPTLREKLDILVVGENGDLQVNIESAGLLARKLAETKISAVIDLYELSGKGEPWDKRRQFVANFINALMNLPKNLRHPMLIIVDEAHQFAPEAKGSEFSTMSRSAINSLMSAGRKRGFGGILATQRISKIHKDSIADARNIFIGGTTLDIDQERAGDMLGMKKSESVSLRNLSPGHFYAFGPALPSREIFKFISAPVKTTHPKAGDRAEIEVPKASKVLTEIIGTFGDLPAIAKEEAQDILYLQKENRRLQQELHARPVQIQPETKFEKVEVPVISDEQMADLANIVLAFNEIGGHFTEEVNKFQRVISVAKEFTNKPLHHNTGSPPMRFIGVDVAKPNSDITVKTVNNEQLSGPEQRILDAIAWFESIKNYSPKQVAVAFLAGYTYGGGAFNNPRGSLRTKGLVEYKGDCISLTVEGRMMANTQQVPLSISELQSHVLEILPGPEKDILSELFTLYPNPISKTELSERVNRRGGAFNNPLGRLRSLGIIEYPQPSMVVALPFLFME